MATDALAGLELVARLIFLVSTLLMLFIRLTKMMHAKYLLLATGVSTVSFFLFLVVAIVRDKGTPTLSIEFARRILTDENLIYIAYGVAVFRQPKAIVLVLPQIITCVLGLGKLYRSHLSVFPRVFSTPTVVKVFKQLNTYDAEIHMVRASLEAAVLFHLILGLFVGGSTIISLLLYTNFIRLK
ncbi:secy-independent transporter protein [Babesia caballi]|uniref:Secy-independent transporter protein n=1 Tax=Babesia caballi TaxID=5871 RepID=A0AAV4LVB8_BABCB|nr:secy-independent transporter protein [Babesia caballi]